MLTSPTDCVRQDILRKLEDLGLQLLYLPSLTSKKPSKATPTIPILSTPLEQLRHKKRVVVIVNSSQEDLGVLSWRCICKKGGIRSGSVVDFVSNVQTRAYKAADAAGLDREAESPGIVILNPGQLLYSYKLGCAVTHTTWLAAPRPSAVHAPPKAHEVHNRIPGNATVLQHISFVFKGILGRDSFVGSRPELYIVGIGDGADNVAEYLASKPTSYKVAAFAITAPVPVSPATSRTALTERNKPFLDLLHERARAWCASEHAKGTPLANATPVDDILQAASPQSIELGLPESMREIALYPMLSAGETQFADSVMPAVTGQILDWFDQVREAGGMKHYSNERLEVDPAIEKQTLWSCADKEDPWAESENKS